MVEIVPEHLLPSAAGPKLSVVANAVTVTTAVEIFNAYPLDHTAVAQVLHSLSRLDAHDLRQFEDALLRALLPRVSHTRNRCVGFHTIVSKHSSSMVKVMPRSLKNLLLCGLDLQTSNIVAWEY